MKRFASRRGTELKGKKGGPHIYYPTDGAEVIRWGHHFFFDQFYGSQLKIQTILWVITQFEKVSDTHFLSLSFFDSPLLPTQHILFQVSRVYGSQLIF